MTRRTFYALVAILVLGCGEEGGGPAGPVLTASVVEVIQGDGQVDTVGQQLPLAIRVQVVDTTGIETAAGFAPPAGSPVPVPGQVVNFVVTSGGGSVFAGAAITDTLGRAQELWTLGPTAGTQCLEARAVDQETGEPLTFAQVCATGVPGPITAAGFLLDSIQIGAGATVSLPVFAHDAFNNPVAVAGVVGLDSLVADSTAGGWQTDADHIGRHRFAYHGDTLRVLAYPAAGHWAFTVTAGDSVINVHGRYQLHGRTGGCNVGAPIPADAMTYQADSFWVVVTTTAADTVIAGTVVEPVGSCAKVGPPGDPLNARLWVWVSTWAWLEFANPVHDGGGWHYTAVQPDWTATEVSGTLTITP